MQPARMKQCILVTFFVLCAAFWGWILFFHLLPALFPLLLGSLIAALIRPVVLFVSKKAHCSEKISSAFVLLFFYLIAILLLLGIGYLAWEVLYFLSGHIPDFYKTTLLPQIAYFFQKLSPLLSRFSPNVTQNVELFWESFRSFLTNFVSGFSSLLFSFCAGFVAKLPIFFFSFAVTIFSSVGISLYWKNISRFLRFLLPKKSIPVFANLKQFFAKTALRAVASFLLLTLITFLELCLGFWILKIPNILGTSALICLLDILPVLGVGTVIIPWAIFSLIAGNIGKGIGLLLLFALMSLIKNFLQPKLLGNCIGLPPLVSLVCLYAGFRLWGLWGALLLLLCCLLIKFWYKNRTSLFSAQNPDEPKTSL